MGTFLIAFITFALCYMAYKRYWNRGTVDKATSVYHATATTTKEVVTNTVDYADLAAKAVDSTIVAHQKTKEGVAKAIAYSKVKGRKMKAQAQHISSTIEEKNNSRIKAKSRSERVLHSKKADKHVF